MKDPIGVRSQMIVSCPENDRIDSAQLSFRSILTPPPLGGSDQNTLLCAHTVHASSLRLLSIYVGILKLITLMIKSELCKVKLFESKRI